MDEDLINLSTIEGVREYYYAHILMLKHAYDEFEEHLEESVEKIQSKASDLQFKNAEHFFSVQLSTHLRYAFLPRFFGLSEIVLGKIRESKNLELRGEGSWFDKTVRCLEAGGCSFTEYEKEIRQLKNLLRIRNCIVHANGSIDACRSPKAVREAITDLGDDVVSEFKEGLIQLGDQAIPTTTTAIRNILSSVFTHEKIGFDFKRG